MKEVTFTKLLDIQWVFFNNNYVDMCKSMAIELNHLYKLKYKVSIVCFNKFPIS